MNTTEEEIIEEEQILSICWDNGVVAASHFNLTTLELNVNFNVVIFN